MMDFNFSSYSGANFPNFMVESSLVRLEEEEDIEDLKETFLQNNPIPIDPFDEMLLEICNKNLAITKSESISKEKENKENNFNSKDENLFRMKFNQNFLMANNLREIDLYNNTNSYVSVDKKEFRFQQQKGFQFKNLKKIYAKTKEETNKNSSESESQDLIGAKKGGIFDNYSTNDHDKYFDPNVKNANYKNSIKQPNAIINNKKNSASHGYRSSLSILTKKNDFVKGLEPQIDIKTIMEHQDESRDEKVDNSNSNIYKTEKPEMKKKENINPRPSYVDKLFKKYDYEDIRPKNIQNMTRNKTICLSVIKEVYNKICNWVNN